MGPQLQSVSYWGHSTLVNAGLCGAVGVAHRQAEAERCMAALNRHFPTRAPRSNWVPL